jgi:hypothetical protein
MKIRSVGITAPVVPPRPRGEDERQHDREQPPGGEEESAQARRRPPGRPQDERVPAPPDGPGTGDDDDDYAPDHIDDYA